MGDESLALFRVEADGARYFQDKMSKQPFDGRTQQRFMCAMHAAAIRVQRVQDVDVKINDLGIEKIDSGYTEIYIRFRHPIASSNNQDSSGHES